MRYFLSLPTTWQDESARYLIIWGVLLGSAVAIRDNQHIKVDVLYEAVSLKWKKIFNILSNVLVFIFLITMIYFGALLVIAKFKTNELSNIGVPMYIIYSILPLSGSFMAVRTVINLFNIKTLSGEIKS